MDSVIHRLNNWGLVNRHFLGTNYHFFPLPIETRMITKTKIWALTICFYLRSCLIPLVGEVEFSVSVFSSRKIPINSQVLRMLNVIHKNCCYEKNQFNVWHLAYSSITPVRSQVFLPPKKYYKMNDYFQLTLWVQNKRIWCASLNSFRLKQKRIRIGTFLGWFPYDRKRSQTIADCGLQTIAKRAVSI